MRYEHDCSACQPLGEHEEFDLYFCSAHHPTVIARFGEGPRYYSGLGAADRIPSLGEARERAVQAGLITGAA